ncbi:uncharacterized protein EV422DRAFT_528212 [Fimicolochytrium jonesii]|uniref:uncharacterized protein n=1 Tax=Fimicolochytrium jonesii TaxID=1396493 RepID=UPI0022FDDAC4|nr:uncharacterized protein EV422DRAFT_528212 [Fimicolochytrium jonesii]KAI8821462.1 hypothetical protein EV422DRAFT_528212 [Fimicolochytrium jonesii]
MTVKQVQASTLVLPIIDLRAFLSDPESAEAKAECEKAAEALTKYSALAVRDPRVSEDENRKFLDTMEDYFAQPYDAKLPDARPDFGYQVGVTPENTEKPRCGRDESCNAMVAQMAEENKPLPYDGTDPKWRFFWRIGEAPKETQFQRLNASPVMPAAFPQWETVMNTWGYLMHDAVSVLAEMLAIGFGLPRKTFVDMAKYGPHLLAPTGSDLEKYGKVGTVLAGFHTDLNFLTIHGKSRFPGLHVWTREGQKLLAKVPDGCLLVQAGKQMQWLTGGHVTAGFHEVCVVEDTLKSIERQKAQNRPLWRISSTLFYHIASDNVLRPLGGFATPQALKQYPDILAGKQVQAELGFISLMDEKTV